MTFWGYEFIMNEIERDSSCECFSDDINKVIGKHNCMVIDRFIIRF